MLRTLRGFFLLCKAEPSSAFINNSLAKLSRQDQQFTESRPDNALNEHFLKYLLNKED